MRRGERDRHDEQQGRDAERHLQRGGGQQHMQREPRRLRQGATQPPPTHSSDDRRKGCRWRAGGDRTEPRRYSRTSSDKTGAAGHSRPAPAARPSAGRCCRSARHGCRRQSRRPRSSARRARARPRRLAASRLEPERGPAGRATYDAERRSTGSRHRSRERAARWATSRYWLTSTRSASPLSTMYQPSAPWQKPSSKMPASGGASAPRQSPPRQKPQERHGKGDADQPAQQPVHVFPKIDALELVQASSRSGRRGIPGSAGTLRIPPPSRTADSGGTMPTTGFHSVIDRPERVSRVIPPTTTITKIIAQQANSQTATWTAPVFGRSALSQRPDVWR